MVGPKGRNEELAICAWNKLAERARGGQGEKEVFNSSILSCLLSIANSLKKLAETEEYEVPPPCMIPHREENDKYGFYEDI